MFDYRKAILPELDCAKLHLEQAARLTKNKHPNPAERFDDDVQHEITTALEHLERAAKLV